VLNVSTTKCVTIKKLVNQPKTRGINKEDTLQDGRTTGGAGEAPVDHLGGE